MTAPLSVAPRHPGPARGRRLGRGALAAALVLLLGGAWLLWDNLRLDVSSYEVAVADAPDGEVLRIAHVSDLHASEDPGFQDAIVRKVEARGVDLVALTGDLVDRSTRDLAPVLELAARLQTIAPTYFVLGNHEADSPLRQELLVGLAEAGVVILRDEATQLQVKGRTVTVAGLDDPRVASADGRTPEEPGAVLDRLDLASSASDGTEAAARGPVVLLAHRPELLAQYAGRGADVVLSGHAHGGQVRLPLLGPLFAPHQGLFPELTEGTHEADGTTMVISRGLGNGIGAVRVNDPRELVILDLVQEADAG
ncbi:metallophosphoesterase [Brachybacterium sp. EE-P12]|uniref:metallophosphoesterase n=1 Tax=Brachybacterium sp. EE-P12 TaxID=2306299 RepID=UPI000F08A6BA|nr:metallophosphoesterase [Brachybacterium sp. EE-P12]